MYHYYIAFTDADSAQIDIIPIEWDDPWDFFENEAWPVARENGWACELWDSITDEMIYARCWKARAFLFLLNEYIIYFLS